MTMTPEKRAMIHKQIDVILNSKTGFILCGDVTNLPNDKCSASGFQYIKDLSVSQVLNIILESLESENTIKVRYEIGEQED